MKIQKIKLNNLAENSLANREMKGIKGGNCCTCGCMYANSGGSSSTDNRNANHAKDLDSTSFGDYIYFKCTP